MIYVYTSDEPRIYDDYGLVTLGQEVEAEANPDGFRFAPLVPAVVASPTYPTPVPMPVPSPPEAEVSATSTPQLEGEI